MPDLDALDSAIAVLGQLGEEPPHLAAERKMLQARFRTRAIVHIQLQLDEDPWQRAELWLAVANFQFLNAAEIDRLKEA